MRHKYNIYNNSPTSFVLKLHIIKCVSFPAEKKKFNRTAKYVAIIYHKVS